MNLSCRDAEIADYPAIHEIAREWFPASTLLPEAQFALMLSRSPSFARVMEQASGQTKGFPDGYYALWPMSLLTMKSLMAGKLRERDLGEEHWLDPRDGQAEVLYVMDVCIRRRVGARSGLRLLLDLRAAIRQKLIAFPRLVLVAAWAYTPVGATLCATAAMTPAGLEADGPRIWTGQRGTVLAALAYRGGKGFAGEF